LRARDERDSQRAAAPLKPAADAKLLDTSSLSVDQAVDQVVQWYQSAVVKS
jgi:cytidylate kinase